MLRTFVYKRTHEGDPDVNGCFGCCDCMGKKRNLDFQAVIGVGGIGREATKSGIAGIVTWVGIGPRRKSGRNLRGKSVTFDQFIYFGTKGPEFRKEAPQLSKRMYSKNGPRFLIDDITTQEQAEIQKLLARVKKYLLAPRIKEVENPQNTSCGGLPSCPPSICRKKRCP